LAQQGYPLAELKKGLFSGREFDPKKTKKRFFEDS